MIYVCCDARRVYRTSVCLPNIPLSRVTEAVIQCSCRDVSSDHVQAMKQEIVLRFSRHPVCDVIAPVILCPFQPIATAGVLLRLACVSMRSYVVGSRGTSVQGAIDALE